MRFERLGQEAWLEREEAKRASRGARARQPGGGMTEGLGPIGLHLPAAPATERPHPASRPSPEEAGLRAGWERRRDAWARRRRWGA